MYEALVARVRYHIQKAEFMGLKNAESTCLLKEAADAIAELSKQVDDSIPKSDAEIIIAEVGKPRWIPVTERLPKYGTPVLAYRSRGGIFIAKHERARAEWDVDYWWKLNSSIHTCNPTHWMPLPEPPMEETE